MPAPTATLRSSNWAKLAIIPASLLLLATIAWHVQQMRARHAALELPPPTKSAPNSAATAPDLTVLSQWEPYGTVTEDTGKAAAPVVASALNIQLRGTLAPSGNDKGSAIIADESGTEKAYRVGDSITGDATLAEVKPRQIVIKHAEQLESVELPKTPSEGGGEGAALPEATNLPAAAPPPPPKNPAKPAGMKPATNSPPTATAPAPAMPPTAPAVPASTPEALPPGNN